MPRFIAVCGKAPHLVNHPGVPDGAAVKRFAGWRELAEEDKPPADERQRLHSHFEPVEEVLLWTPELARAAAAGEFASARIVIAPNFDKARAALTAPRVEN